MLPAVLLDQGMRNSRDNLPYLNQLSPIASSAPSLTTRVALLEGRSDAVISIVNTCTPPPDGSRWAVPACSW